MSLLNSSSNGSENAAKESDVLSAEKKAALQARFDKLMTPAEFARSMNELLEYAAEGIAIGERLLKSKKP